jgi:NitT/TauT family transport system permease protein
LAKSARSVALATQTAERCVHAHSPGAGEIDARDQRHVLPCARSDRPCVLAPFARPAVLGPCREEIIMTTIAVPSPATPGKLASWISRNGPVLAIFALVFAVWEIAVRALQIPDYILPSPSVIVVKIVVSWQLLLVNAFVTLQEILLGFGLSVVIAIPLAIAVVYSRIFERVAFPFMVSLQTIPKVALAPILVIWLGYGIMPKVMVAFLISFFPIVINSVIGMRSAEKEMIYLVQSMGASELTTFLKIRLPKALPSIFGGLKVGIGQAVVGATVGEFIAAEAGLGYLQLISQVRLDTPLLFAAVVVLSLLGVLLFNAVAFAERIALPWSRVATDVAE